MPPLGPTPSGKRVLVVSLPKVVTQACQHPRGTSTLGRRHPWTLGTYFEYACAINQPIRHWFDVAVQILTGREGSEVTKSEDDIRHISRCSGPGDVGKCIRSCLPRPQVVCRRIFEQPPELQTRDYDSARASQEHLGSSAQLCGVGNLGLQPHKSLCSASKSCHIHIQPNYPCNSELYARDQSTRSRLDDTCQSVRLQQSSTHSALTIKVQQTPSWAFTKYISSVPTVGAVQSPARGFSPAVIPCPAGHFSENSTRIFCINITTNVIREGYDARITQILVSPLKRLTWPMDMDPDLRAVTTWTTPPDPRNGYP